jgi:acetylornithine deacetylase/succinyl-diaminopimelate desuccinylase-like protein
MDLRERIASLMSRVRPELAELVAIRSVADPRQFPPEECARAAQWVLDAFAGAGFSDARLAEMADGSHAVLGSRPGPDPDAPTMLLYAHYDVQPPLNEADWRTPPFELTQVDGRWYGRGAADCNPDAELILMGVEEPLALIHAPNESVDPAEIAAMALTEALFLQRYAAIRG